MRTYSTFRAVWIRGAGVKPLRGGVAPTPPVPNSCENRCKSALQALWTEPLRFSLATKLTSSCRLALWAEKAFGYPLPMVGCGAIATTGDGGAVCTIGVGVILC